MKLTIPMEPVPKARARVTKRGFAYTPKKTEQAENTIRWACNGKERFEREVPLSLTITFYRSRPKSAPKRRIYPTTRPDWDNYAKLVCDALEKFAYCDDSQIVDAHIYKRYTKEGHAPRVEIEITEADERE